MPPTNQLASKQDALSHDLTAQSDINRRRYGVIYIYVSPTNQLTTSATNKIFLCRLPHLHARNLSKHTATEIPSQDLGPEV